MLSRQLLESEIFGKPPHFLKLWLWLLIKAYWTDGNGLKRGQLRTSLAEMQEVGCYRMGNRPEGKLTVSQVRNACNFLTTTGAIKTANSTRGITITIMNFDIYQNPDNYEQHQQKAKSGQRADSTADNRADSTEEQPEMLGIIRKCQQMSAADSTPDNRAESPRTAHYLKEENKESIVASKTLKRPPSGNHQLFISWWHYAFEKTQGRPYLFAAKDAKAVKNLLTIHPIRHLVLAACHFLTVDDAFLNNRRDLPMLLSQINRMPGPSDPAHHGGTRYRAAELLPPEGVKLENWRFYDTTPPPKELSHAA